MTRPSTGTATHTGPSVQLGKPKPMPRPQPRPAPRPRTYLVTRIVDGDTLELGNGETVRLVGIDTPEVGQCGYDAASVALARLAAGKQVRLGRSDEDRDHYGRLLRYVDVGSTDAGLRLIRSGLAIARYDSRDGYGFHPREPRYVAADKASRNVGCPKPAPAPQPLVGRRGLCAGVLAVRAAVPARRGLRRGRRPDPGHRVGPTRAGRGRRRRGLRVATGGQGWWR